GRGGGGGRRGRAGGRVAAGGPDQGRGGAGPWPPVGHPARPPARTGGGGLGAGLRARGLPGPGAGLPAGGPAGPRRHGAPVLRLSRAGRAARRARTTARAMSGTPIAEGSSQNAIVGSRSHSGRRGPLST